MVLVAAWGTVFVCSEARAQAASGAQGGAAAKAGKEKEETCRVSGLVVKMADGSPLKNAMVRLENEEDHEHTIAARSGADGRFELRNVPAARYKLRVSRNGYVEKEYGQIKPSDPGAVFALAPGEDKRVFFQLIPAAVIAGRVFDGYTVTCFSGMSVPGISSPSLTTITEPRPRSGVPG